MRNLINLVVILNLILFSFPATSSENRSVFRLSTVEQAKAARNWLANQDYQDGISKEEATLVGAMYWRNHQHEYRFFAGAIGDPEDKGENWFIPYHHGAAAERSDHGVLINKLTGECSHPHLKGDFAHLLLELEIEKLDRFIANQLLKNDAKNSAS